MDQRLLGVLLGIVLSFWGLSSAAAQVTTTSCVSQTTTASARVAPGLTNATTVSQTSCAPGDLSTLQLGVNNYSGWGPSSLSASYEYHPPPPGPLEAVWHDSAWYGPGVMSAPGRDSAQPAPVPPSYGWR